MDKVESSDILLQFQIDATIYNETVLFKTLYWLTPLACLNVSKPSLNIFLVSITPIQGVFSEEFKKDVENRLRKDLIDFKVRYIINEETSLIRNMIIAKAFASEEFFDKDPEGLISDPIGFNPGL